MTLLVSRKCICLIKSSPLCEWPVLNRSDPCFSKSNCLKSVTDRNFFLVLRYKKTQIRRIDFSYVLKLKFYILSFY